MVGLKHSDILQNSGDVNFMAISKYNSKINEQFLCNAIEDQYFDRKSSKIKPKDIAPHLCAFANANGGCLAIGISDDKKIEGFNKIGEEKINEFLKVPYDLCTPTPKYDTEILNINNEVGQLDKVLLFHVEPSTNKIIKTSSNDVYLRIGDSSKKLTYEDIKKLEYDKGERLFEEELVERSSIEDIDSELLAEYKKKVDSYLSDKEILEARGFLYKGQLTIAGVLLFSKTPEKFIPNCKVRFIRYDGLNEQVGTEMNIIKDISIYGALHKIIEQSKVIIAGQLREFNALNSSTGKFDVVSEYPEFAWQEGIVNAVTHRDYSLKGECIKVIMYDDRLEIMSPGNLPNIVNIKNLKYTRYSRNPKVARILSEFGWVKELNEGIKRIYKEMNEYYLEDPKFIETKGSLKLVLKNNIIMRRMRNIEQLSSSFTKGIWDSLSKQEVKAIELIYINGRVTTMEFAEKIDRSPKVARKILKELTEKGLLEWNGTSKNDPKQYFQLKTIEK